jgi:Flp pilus assembly pilin Flp
LWAVAIAAYAQQLSQSLQGEWRGIVVAIKFDQNSAQARVE